MLLLHLVPDVCRPVFLGVLCKPMVVLGGIVGGIVGFLIGLLITEAIIGTPADSSGFDWQFWTDAVLAIVGVLLGSAVARRFIHRSANA
jgi:uncharacterized membrane protein YvlD (DUF360 family)